ncbi:MAG: hypothetical protein DRH12_16315 [Deltaproteobacteria bacterium]|nr:MAG: hypothetical protein DRH12_16315 [Deltaproteobacteria bacterium]
MFVSLIKRMFFNSLFVLIVTSVVSAQTFLSADIPFSQGGDTYLERDVVYHEGKFAPYLKGEDLGLPPGSNINAFCLYNRTRNFSVDIPVTLNGNTYTERNIISYDGNNLSLLLDGESLGIPPGVQIDAATVLPGGITIFSIDCPATIRGQAYQPNDLIRYNGKTVSLFFKGADHGIPQNANIDGVWISDGGNTILFSLDIPCNLGGLSVDDKDIVEWSGGSFSLYFDGTLEGLPGGANLVALHHEYLDSDYDGLPDSLEGKWCTDPNDPDTDNDGLRDGVEDSNHNGIVDKVETSPCNPDTDGDRMTDGWERTYGLDALNDDAFEDKDQDGFCNYREFVSHSNPANNEDIPCLIADVDGDDDVDGVDLAALAAEYGWVNCGTKESCSCDFDKDTVVDVIDLIFFAEDYGKIMECYR